VLLVEVLLVEVPLDAPEGPVAALEELLDAVPEAPLDAVEPVDVEAAEPEVDVEAEALLSAELVARPEDDVADDEVGTLNLLLGLSASSQPAEANPSQSSRR
jgi:hypothetical protein